MTVIYPSHFRRVLHNFCLRQAGSCRTCKHSGWWRPHMIGCQMMILIQSTSSSRTGA